MSETVTQNLIQTNNDCITNSTRLPSRTSFTPRLPSRTSFTSRLPSRTSFTPIEYYLLEKLQYYGFRGIINDWFKSYLTNSTQTTQIRAHISRNASITCGVPQGSVLGPLMLLLYINDKQNCSDKFQFFLFAEEH